MKEELTRMCGVAALDDLKDLLWFLAARAGEVRAAGPRGVEDRYGVQDLAEVIELMVEHTRHTLGRSGEVSGSWVECLRRQAEVFEDHPDFRENWRLRIPTPRRGD